MGRKVIPAGELKQGRPVARLVPMLSHARLEAEILAGLRGSVKVRVSERELLRPTGDEGGWVLEPNAAERSSSRSTR